MMAELEPIMKKNLPKSIRTRDNLYDYFIMRARANLHIALCFSPVIIYDLQLFSNDNHMTFFKTTKIRLVKNSVIVH